MVIVVIAIMSTIAIKSLTPTMEQARETATINEMELLAEAIIGNKNLIEDGIRTDYGYVGDVGSLPPDLDALVTNPGGYSTWNGPYIRSDFTEDADDYKKDAWGNLYTYSGGVTITSSGGGSTITKQFAQNVSDLTSNTVTGNIYDGLGAVPGDSVSKVTVTIFYPDGSGGTTSSSTNPSSSGGFSFVGSIPIGNHIIRGVYSTENDTTSMYVSVPPVSGAYCELRLSGSWFSGGGGGGGGFTGWGRRCELVIQASQVPGNLTDFPVLLTESNLPSEMLDKNGSHPALDGGGDIRFSSDQDGNNRLSCEIVTYITHNNPNSAKAEIWVKVPSISSSSNTSIWVWYDKAGETQPAENESYGSESVWDVNYLMVQHMDEDPTSSAPQFVDATNNDHDGTNNGGLKSTDLKNCVIGDGIEFDGNSDDDIDLGIWDVSGNQLTVQHWVYYENNASNNGRCFSRATGTAVDNHWIMTDFHNSENPAFRLKTNSNTTHLQYSTNLSKKTWYFFACTYDGSTMRIWINNQNVASTPKSGNIDTSSTIHNYLGDNPSGSRQMKGRLDEVRVSSVRRSDSWLGAEYNNQNSPSTFVIPGTPETP